MAVSMELVDDGLATPGSGKKVHATKKRKKKPKQSPEKKLRRTDDENNDGETVAEEGTDSVWNLRTVSGLDLISKAVSVTPDSKHVIVNSADRVLVYAAASGHVVRSLNTGPILAAVAGPGEGEVYVASRKKICLWNFHTVKIVKQFPLFAKESKCEFISSDILDIFIPAKFKTNCLVFVTVKTATKHTLYRVSVGSHTINRIFKDIKVGSVHVGDNGNSVCAISSVKEGYGKDAALLVYDQNLSKVLVVRTDVERPFTVARVHPAERVVAAGDTSGRIIVYSGLQQPEPSKAVMHWHSLAVAGLAWSEEGATLYSGGGEAVLCKWRPADGSKPQFVPRLEAPVVALGGGGGLTVLQLANNSLVLLDRQEDRVMGVVGGLARSETGWPAGLAADRDRLLLNGCVGKVQVWSGRGGGRVHSIDITGQNYLTKERLAAPHNSEVERLAVSGCGRHLATLDCQWSCVPRVTLRLWTFDPALENFSLNTQVDGPHEAAVQELRFQPRPSGSSGPLLLSVGTDRRAKLWGQAGALGAWTCTAALQLRGLAANSGDWSDDGSVLGIAFGHLVTLWDADTRLRATLAVEGVQEPVTGIAFGRGPSARLLLAASGSLLQAWDLLTLGPAWSLALQASPHTRLVPSPTAPLLALVQKDQVVLLSTATGQPEHTVEDTNCTGGAAWLADPQAAAGSALHFLTYSGELKRLGSAHLPAADTPVGPGALASHLGRLLAGGVAAGGPAPVLWTAARRQDDIEAVLSLPLHALPPPSQLAAGLVRARLLGLPRIKPAAAGPKVSGIGADAETRKKVEKLESTFKFEEDPVDSLNFKAFCKLFKNTSLPTDE